MLRHKRRWCAALLFVSLILSGRTAVQADVVQFTVLHTNDFHGNLEASGSNPGAARVAAKIQQIRAAKGPAYPKLPSLVPNQTHQGDWVGPCYLTGPLRFYSLNVVDAATGRCRLHPCGSKAGQQVIDALWAIWQRLGIPDNLQIDIDVDFHLAGALANSRIASIASPGNGRSQRSTVAFYSNHRTATKSRWPDSLTCYRDPWLSNKDTTAPIAIVNWAEKRLCKPWRRPNENCGSLNKSKLLDIG